MLKGIFDEVFEPVKITFFGVDLTEVETDHIVYYFSKVHK
jgi:hypothetical protein